MKNLIIALSLILLVLVGFISLMGYEKNKYKKRLTDQIFKYEDSIKMWKVQLIRIGLNENSTFADKLGQRMHVRGRIWHYQWKIDSLNIRLKQY